LTGGARPGAAQRIPHQVRLHWPKISFFCQILMAEKHTSIFDPAQLDCEYQAVTRAAQMALRQDHRACG
jgi:hypothetical protein